MAKRLGINPSLFAEPLFHLFTQGDDALGDFLVSEDIPAQLAIRLREKSLDAAFLSPIDYARDYAMYAVLPGFCLAAEHRSQSAIIIFKENLRKISTLAVSPSSSSEIVLATIVCAERFDGMPTLIPFIGSVDDGLGKADAVLCIGDQALAESGRPAQLDLVEEWSDMTDLPFVHGIWITRPHGLTGHEVETLTSVSRRCIGTFRPDDTHREYLQNFRYELDERPQSGLNEFFRMAYYYGILGDLPDLRYVSFEDGRSAFPGGSS